MDLKKEKLYTQEQLIRFGYYVRKHPNVVMRENYLNWLKEPDKDWKGK